MIQCQVTSPANPIIASLAAELGMPEPDIWRAVANAVAAGGAGELRRVLADVVEPADRVASIGAWLQAWLATGERPVAVAIVEPEPEPAEPTAEEPDRYAEAAARLAEMRARRKRKPQR